MLPLPLADLSDDDDEPRQLSPRVYQQRTVLANLTDGEVKEKFRLKRDTIALLEERLAPILQPKYHRRTDLSVGDKLAIALKYYASGDQYRTIGEARGVSAKSVSVVVDSVTEALLQLAPDVIKVPTTLRDVNQIKQGFYEVS